MGAVIQNHFTEKHGPLVEIRIALTADGTRDRKRQALAVPQPAEILALIDTGAEVSCLDEQIALRLGLPPACVALFNAAALGGFGITISRECQLTILNPSCSPADPNLEFEKLDVVVIDLAGLGYQALLGRDVLSKCTLTYNGPARSFSLAY